SIVNNTVIVRKRKETLNNSITKPTVLQQTIAGRVQNQEGQPLIGVSVRIKNKEIGTTTNEQGEFQINAEIGDVVIFTSVGFESIEINITSTSALRVVMSSQSFELEELVVTAFGIRRSRNNLPYAAQQVSG